MSNTVIKDIIPRQVLDSRGNPTVEVELILTDDSRHFASVPSGASTGKYEAVELRDSNVPNLYNGNGVLQALINIDVMITPNLIGLDPRNQKKIDTIIDLADGTDNLSIVGANAALAVSIACTKAGAHINKIPLYQYISNILQKEYEVQFAPNMIFPTPMVNILNGGAHAQNNIATQEFMIVPDGISDIREKIRASSEILHALKTILKEKKLNTGVGDEGGYAPNLPSDQAALEYIMRAIKKAGYEPKEEINLALDVAISQFFIEERKLYQFPHQLVNDKVVTVEGTSDELTELYINMVQKYPIISIEDGYHEDDWVGFATLKPFMESQDKLCVGDDLTVTNTDLIEKAIKSNAINAVIIKPNQIGLVSRVFDAIKLCKENNIKIIVSHRSGETTDTFISHLAVGSQASYLKAGGPQRGERVEKYNELMRMITPEMARKVLNIDNS